MKIYYMNDETKPVHIRIPGRDIVILRPQESRIFHFDAPASAVPFVKRWDNNIVLLSYTTEPSVVSSESSDNS